LPIVKNVSLWTRRGPFPIVVYRSLLYLDPILIVSCVSLVYLTGIGILAPFYIIISIAESHYNKILMQDEYQYLSRVCTGKIFTGTVLRFLTQPRSSLIRCSDDDVLLYELRIALRILIPVTVTGTNGDTRTSKVESYRFQDLTVP
jgi:hypothetical protein